ncbi:suppressor of glycerol defect [Tulasnella sp. JGI-2019a]|nr:suppressor of glycerol defect [Tulasnella sp. JGI-2019a]
MPQHTRPIRLPRALRDELAQGEESQNTRPKGRPGKPPPLTRKESRKQARQDKKAKRVVIERPFASSAKSELFRQSKESVSAARTKRLAPELVERHATNKRRRVETTASSQHSGHEDIISRSEKSVSFALDIPETAPTPKPKPVKGPTPLERLLASQTGQSIHESLPEPGKKSPKLQLSQAEKQEDDEIAWLEARLKLNKGKKGKKKSKRNEDEEDDENDLDDFLDRIVIRARSRPSKVGTSSPQTDELSDLGGSSDSSSDTMEYDEASPDDNDETGFDDIDSKISDATEAENEQDEEEDPPELIDRSSQPESSHPSASGRYIPPALRKAAGDTEAVKTEAQIKLNRQLKGLLNKLSDQNISAILSDIDDLYQQNARNDVTVALTTLIIDSIASHASLLDTFVILHAALVASLHRIVGIEFAAHFVQSVIDSYEGNYATAISTPSNSDDPASESLGGKAASNLLTLIAQLYTFQVISCVLVYDIIRGFLSGNLGELEVELFLKLLKAIGPQLRQDDPAALKEIITLVQTKTASTDKSQQSSRTCFMLETLSNLKNNKMLPSGSAGQKVGQKNANVTADAVDRMKRLIKSLGKGGKTIRSHEPLNVTLDDLHSADKRGKWWLVGSAWAGDPLLDAVTAASERVDPEPLINLGDQNRTSALLKLAKKQGMNTDVRRSIFVVLMSSDDYIEACDRLLQLKIGDQQRAEIVRVMLHCCSREKAYNPYYTLVGQHLSGLNRNIMFSQQYCLWDLFREMGEPMSGEDNATGDDDDADRVPALRVRNYARTYAWWVAKGSLTLTILKPLNFAALKTQTATFLRIFLAQLIVSSQSASPMLDCATSSDKDAASLSRDRSIVELIMVKAFKQSNVVRGLIQFLNAEAADLQAEANVDGVRDIIAWGVKIAIGALSAGEDLVP